MKESMIIVPEEFLKSIKDKQDMILSLLQSRDLVKLSEFITEKEAMKMFNRKSTWFWEMRKNRQLPYSKIGRTIYYSRAELNALLEKNKKTI